MVQKIGRGGNEGGEGKEEKEEEEEEEKEEDEEEDEEDEEEGRGGGMREKHVLLGAGTFPGIILKFYIRQIYILLY